MIGPLPWHSPTIVEIMSFLGISKFLSFWFYIRFVIHYNASNVLCQNLIVHTFCCYWFSTAKTTNARKSWNISTRANAEDTKSTGLIKSSGASTARISNEMVKMMQNNVISCKQVSSSTLSSMKITSTPVITMSERRTLTELYLSVDKKSYSKYINESWS